VVVGALAFFGGMKFQESKGGNGGGGFGARNGGPRGGSGQFGRGAGGGGRVVGEVISNDGKTMIVKLADGSSKIVILSEKSTVNKESAGTKEELTKGTKVGIFGTENTDGSVTATALQINPNIGMIGGGKSANTAAKSSDAREIVVDGSNYKFVPDTITVKKGEKTRIVFKSAEGMHDFQVDGLNISTAVVQSGKEDFVEFTLDKAGSFEFFCSVGSHRDMGMKGTLIVE
ncbi:cupredoxin domain-containing protein, partial [Candidatus Gottesmanbacteria bacterium]|nr:cupredoxin domain-containing protein [Candidatus Gottesmanbacteria bacterium]